MHRWLLPATTVDIAAPAAVVAAAADNCFPPRLASPRLGVDMPAMQLIPVSPVAVVVTVVVAAAAASAVEFAHLRLDPMPCFHRASTSPYPGGLASRPSIDTTPTYHQPEQTVSGVYTVCTHPAD